jgi:hypothetical protein
LREKAKIVSNEKNVNVFERLWKLQAKINMMVLDGVRNSEEVAKILQTIVSGAERITIPARGNIVTANRAREVFPGYIDARLLYWKTKVTLGTNVRVEEITEDGKFSDFFGKDPAKLNTLRLQWGQVVLFCNRHRNKLGTSRNRLNGTFFLVTKDGELVLPDLSNVSVVNVNVNLANQLEAYLYDFLYGDIWYASCRHHLVSP